MLRYVESVQLPYASQIAESAHKQFMAGEINYLDWTMLMNQSIQLRSNYLDAIKKQNELINQINYLISR
jgi:cobalt-zinc-cadmium resistance protein CzcA